MACMKLGMKKYYVGYWDLLGQKSAMRGVGEFQFLEPMD